MAVRTIKLKLILPRDTEHRQWTHDLWSTHRTVNEATHYYESRLLEMRGLGYRISDEQTFSETDVATRLCERVRMARKANGCDSELSTADWDEIRDLLHRLYLAIIPSAVEGGKGKAQEANAFLSPLTDPTSRAFLDIFDKIDSVPDWVTDARDGLADAFDRAREWLATADGQRRLKATGSPPGWVRQFRQGKTDWPVAFTADYDRKLEAAAGVPTCFKRLRELGVIPLFPPAIAPRAGIEQGVTRWDRLAFRLAAAHLLSWESWCRLAAREHAQRKDRVNQFAGRHLAEVEARLALASIQGYEQARQIELERVSQLGPIRSFRITPRMLRGWRELREDWLEAVSPSFDVLMDISRRRQTQRRGAFGDPDLFCWLAQPGQHALWNSRVDYPTLIGQYNAMLGLVERSRDTALMTLPDASDHPRCVQWEATGGSNLYTYLLSQGPDDELWVSLQLLRAIGNRLDTVESRYRLAPSGQLKNPELTRTDAKGQNQRIRYTCGNGEQMQGGLGSADLLLDWNHLRNLGLDRLEAGEIGPAWLKLAIDLDPAPDITGMPISDRAARHFTTARGNEKYADDITVGMRVLSVDLGLRAFAHCAVFELRDQLPTPGKLAFHVEPGGLWAVHERSFRLSLPGESISTKEQGWRNQVDAELRALRRAIFRTKRLYRLTDLEPEIRSEVLATSFPDDESAELLPHETSLQRELKNAIELPIPLWNERVNDLLRTSRHALGKLIADWRRKTRARGLGKASGKSAWSIDHLTRVRRLLQSWSLIGVASQDIRRHDRARQGVFARQLLSHLEGLKDDRLKTGADLIVQAARGYVRNAQGRWLPEYPACHVVLFEDLSRYRMRTDRPRRENSQLMRWAHRAIPDVVGMQGELYGLKVHDTGAAFSSRYHAASHTPGIRCHVLTHADLADPFFLDLIGHENPGLDTGRLRAGDRAPLAGGEWFAWPRGDGGIGTVQADINAAQNLQRRFWTRHRDAFRLPCRKMLHNGEVRWVPTALGKRLMGALEGPGWLVPTGHALESCRWESLKPARWKALCGQSGADAVDEADLDELLNLEEETLEQLGEVIVFFRDPSSVVLPASFWYPSRTFWGIVRQRTARGLGPGFDRVSSPA
jgi:hypothetical protein